MTTLPDQTIDVRTLLAEGRDPFAAIMEAKSKLRPGQALQLIAPFEPKPLYAVFEAAGFTVEPVALAPERWSIRFVPTPDAGGSADSTVGDGLELDLRRLEPPAPLHHALEAMGALGRGKTLILHTRLRPVHLFEQLDPDAFDYDCEERGPQHWCTRLWRVSLT